RCAAVFRTWNDLDRALGKAEPKNEKREALVVAVFTDPCRVVCAQWDAILTTLDNGEAVKITPAKARRGRWGRSLGPQHEQNCQTAVCRFGNSGENQWKINHEFF